ncbi:polygalacturonase inhibitor-like [Macadamia integrifolia]|uniref:polygalacturonase inhibitor-like n=1 Tax=Macadamia integrifolia TaxID=60698 RepID=UPI001C4EA7FE|nr:polygalacturonase inhibitor-like [Macadamia integrifolia]
MAVWVPDEEIKIRSNCPHQPPATSHQPPASSLSTIITEAHYCQFSQISTKETMDTRLSLFPLISTILFLSFLPTPSFSRSLATSVRCNKHDYNALMRIKAALHNPYHLASWVPNTDCCDWYSVECDSTTNRIVTLSIFQANISGQIPEAVGDLPYLNYVMFHHITNLTGTIPSTLTNLKHLTTLRLSNTNLSGPIPSFLSQIPSLDFLELSFNQFSGSIPSSLSSLANLTDLHLDRNSLTGSIPESFGKFKQPSLSLYLSHNQLSGEIPKSLGDVDFNTIDLSRNMLQGDASMLFKANGSTEGIDLSRNHMLEFDLSKVEFAKNLQHLDISHNKIYGSIPEAITGLDLQYLNVSYNRLCGKIPQGGKVQNFDSYSFYHNKCLCGSPLTACK